MGCGRFYHVVFPFACPNGRYQLQAEIARGGMRAIVKGRDIDLGRDLAIKVLSTIEPPSTNGADLD